MKRGNFSNWPLWTLPAHSSSRTGEELGNTFNQTSRENSTALGSAAKSIALGHHQPNASKKALQKQGQVITLLFLWDRVRTYSSMDLMVRCRYCGLLQAMTTTAATASWGRNSGCPLSVATPLELEVFSSCDAALVAPPPASVLPA